MQTISRKEFLEKLSLYVEKKIELNIAGNIRLQIDFEKFMYEINEDILKIKDETNSNYISINLNNINFIAKSENRFICIFNDNIDTILEIKTKY